MSDQNLSHLVNKPEVRQLFALRRQKYVLLSTIVCVVYFVVAIGCAFAPELMRRPVFGTSISLGITSMAFIMIVAIVTSGYYTWWSNTVRDPLVDRLKASLGWKA